MITQIGLHRVRHGDMMTLGDDLQFMSHRADLVYSDPPWGEGNLKYWNTINQKMTGDSNPVAPLRDFLQHFFALVTRRTTDNAVIFVEYGLRWRELMLDCIHASGLQVLEIATPVYGSRKLPLNLFVLSKRRQYLPDGYRESIDGTWGMSTLRAATRPFVKPGLSIFDPCCGMGYTAQLALESGMIFYGNEINQARLDKTIARLRKGTP